MRISVNWLNEWLGTPAEAREFGLQLADTINNTFTWPSDPVVQ